MTILFEIYLQYVHHRVEKKWKNYADMYMSQWTGGEKKRKKAQGAQNNKPIYVKRKQNKKRYCPETKG